MHVFVLTCSWLSEHTFMTETVGVYAHMHQTIAPAQMLKREGKAVLVTKHEVIEPAPVVTLRLGKPVPAFEAQGPGGTPGVRPVGEGVQTDPSVAAKCHGSGWRDGTCRHGDRAGSL